jgi:glutaredoxin 3
LRRKSSKSLMSMQSVKMYLTATCPYCLRAKSLLQRRGVGSIVEIRVDLQPEQREAMVRLTGRRTVPQIFIGETHVGGCDDLIELDMSGELKPLLEGGTLRA